MRLRKIKNAKERLKHVDYVFLNPEEHKGKWHLIFNNNQPIFLEIGMGKGQFIYQLAKQNPHHNYIGFEKEASVIWKATEKLPEKLNNLIFVVGDASEIDTYFKANEVSCIYLNFSDPWPKARHAKRRLTYASFLTKYASILQTDGKIYFKSDNYNLFTFSLEQFKDHKWEIIDVSENLHQDHDNIITTEYEDRFSALGNPIYYIEVKQWKE